MLGIRCSVAAFGLALLVYTRRAESKLALRVLVPGDGKTFPKEGELVQVHYSGTVSRTGRMFDSSYDVGVPFEFTLGVGEVIEGWDLGLPNMSLGERAILHVPSELAYGPGGAGGIIPPNADLDFDIELLRIGGATDPMLVFLAVAVSIAVCCLVVAAYRVLCHRKMTSSAEFQDFCELQEPSEIRSDSNLSVTIGAPLPIRSKVTSSAESQDRCELPEASEIASDHNFSAKDIAPAVQKFPEPSIALVPGLPGSSQSKNEKTKHSSHNAHNCCARMLC